MRKKEMKLENLELIKNYMSREPNIINMQIDSMRSKLEMRDMEINHIYQRNFILTDRESSKYVESVFLGCSIPEIQLFEEENGVIEILDGQQRVLSLIRFLNNEYPLAGLSELKFLNGHYFKDLPKDLCRKYKNYTLSAKIMKFSELDDDYKYFVFERLNSGSKKLNAQETRNCVYRGNLIEMAKKVAQRDDFKPFILLLGNDKRFKITEFVLRTIANAELFTLMKGTAGTTINYFLRNNKDISDEEVLKLEKKYITALTLMTEHVGASAFEREEESKNNKGKFVITDIEAFLINAYKFFSKYEIINNADEIAMEIYVLINSEEYKRLDKEKARVVTIQKTMMMNKVIGNIVERGISISKRRFFTMEEKVKAWENSRDKQGNVKCSICKNNIISFDDAEVDHKVPYSKGGKTDISNGGIAHSTCNRIKSDSMSA